MDNSVLLTDVQRFSLHDGPGIRTTVFFKGCNLRCAWCHNPETQSRDLQLMYDEKRCVHCGSCVASCPAGALHFEEERVERNLMKCRMCFTCEKACNFGGMQIAGKPYDVDSLTELLLHDTLLYGSGGGVTFSGGEPLLQYGFVREVAEKLRKEGIHVAIDTAGNIAPTIIAGTMEHTDLYLYDVKIMDSDAHRRWTGVPNGLILENLRYLDSHGAEIWIRRPMIHNINDTEEDHSMFMRMLEGMKGVTQVDLLSYHDYGSYKSRALGYEEVLFERPEWEVLESMAEDIRSLGIRAFVRK